MKCKGTHQNTMFHNFKSLLDMLQRSYNYYILLLRLCTFYITNYEYI